MNKVSIAGFSAPIFALALASFIPSQAQAGCSGAADNGANYDGTNNPENIVCAPDQAPIFNDPDAVDVNALDGNDQIDFGNANGAFIVTGSVNGGLGDDKINVNFGSQILGTIEGDDGSDTITVQGFGSFVQQINGGSGILDQILISSGTAVNIDGEAGVDFIDLSGAGIISGDVFGGTGDDQFGVSGGTMMGQNVNLGDDNDVVQILVGAQDDFSSVIFEGGAGTDTFFARFGYNGKVASVTNFENLQLTDQGTVLGLTQDLAFTNLVDIDNGAVLQFLDPDMDLQTNLLDIQGTLEAFGAGVGTFSVFGAGNLTNQGVLDMSDGFAGDEFLIAGNYDGINTPNIRLDVFIGGTGSPADHLLIGGNVTGSTGLDIFPTGFDPQLTGTGPGNGIALVQVAGTTNNTDFFLQGGPINAGAFVYDLVLETDNIWYLQSRLDEVFQAFAGGVTAAQQQGDMVQGTLHQRMGDLRHEEDKHPSDNALQVWMRGFGGGSSVDNDTGRFTVNGGRATAFDGGFDTVTYGGQGGADYGFADLFTGQDRLHLGVMGYYGHTDVDFGVLPVTTDVDGYGGGLYATYIHPNFYVDTSVLAGKLDFRTTDHQRGTTDKYDGDTIGASIETGVPITLGQFVIEPQLQLTYRDVRFDSFETDTGVRVSSDDGESLKGRAGARFAVNLNPTEGFLLSPYVSASVVQEFMGDNTVDADNVRVHSDVEGTSFDGGLGVTASFGHAVSVFAEAGGTVGDDVDSARGNLGVRVSW